MISNLKRVWINPLGAVLPLTKMQKMEDEKKGQSSSLTSKHLADDNSVWATGHFLYKRSGSQSDMTGWEFPKPRRSSENAKYVQNATRSAEGAHAEEQVTNQFEELYQVILGQLKRKESGSPQRHSTLSSASTSPLVAARTAQSTLLTS